MKIENLSCKTVIEYICDNLGEDLDSPRCKKIKEHLDGCDSCNEYFGSVKQTIEFYKRYNMELDEQAHNRLMKFLGLEE